MVGVEHEPHLHASLDGRLHRCQQRVGRVGFKAKVVDGDVKCSSRGIEELRDALSDGRTVLRAV